MYHKDNIYYIYIYNYYYIYITSAIVYSILLIRLTNLKI